MKDKRFVVISVENWEKLNVKWALLQPGDDVEICPSALDGFVEDDVFVLTPERDPASLMALGVYAACAADDDVNREIAELLAAVDEHGMTRLSEHGTRNVMPSLGFARMHGESHLKMVEGVFRSLRSTRKKG